MRITKISVTGLFGMFDHEIPLNQESRITIIHGPNGVGKTVLMRMVHGLFHYEYEYIASIPFEQFRLEYEDGMVLTVEKEIKGDGEDKTLTLRVNCIAENGDIHCPFDIEIVERGLLIDIVKAKRPELVTVFMSNGRLIWAENVDPIEIEDRVRRAAERRGIKDISVDLQLVLQRRLMRSEIAPVIYTKRDLLGSDPEIHNEVYGEMPEWFQIARTGTKTRLISTSRLLREVTEGIENAPDFYRGNLVGDSDTILALEQFFVAPREEPILFLPGKRDAIEEIERFFYYEVDDDIEYHKNAIEELRRFQAEDSYAAQLLESDVEKWLEYHEGSMDSLLPLEFYTAKELASLLNEHLLFKSFCVDDDQYTVTLVNESDGAWIPFSALSSGEQQLLILYYQLVVKTKSDTLVMIDEPELSMNVVWQRNFLKDLQRIIELRKFDVLIATHSPQIIHDKWDWMVPLGEKADA